MQTVSSYCGTKPVSVACLILSSLLCGCGGGTKELSSPDTLVLYSIDGEDHDLPESKYPDSVERFHEYAVLGKTKIEDPKSRQEIAEAVKAGITTSDGTMAKCFWPRHGLRITQSGKSVDYVICFQCQQLKIFRGDDVERLATTATPQKLLNTVLQDAEIELAPNSSAE